MKKLLSVIVAMAMLLSLAACGSQAESPAPTNPPAADNSPVVEVTDPPAEPEKNFNLRINTTSAANDNQGEGLNLFCEKVAELSDTVTAEVHYSGSLYSQAESVPMIMAGNLEMCTSEAAWMAEYMPELAMFGSCYLYKDYNHWNNVMNGEIGAELFDAIAEKVGIRVLAPVYTGARCISLNEDKEITCRADLNGVLLRVANSESWVNMGKALGVDPVPMALSEVYLALQTGAIDGQDNPLPATMAQGFGEVIDSITMTNHVLGYTWICISENIWQQMSEQQQAAVLEAAKYAADYSTQANIADEESLKADFEAMGVKIYEPDTSVIQAEVMDYTFNETDWTKSWDMELYQKIQDAAN